MNIRKKDITITVNNYELIVLHEALFKLIELIRCGSYESSSILVAEAMLDSIDEVMK